MPPANHVLCFTLMISGLVLIFWNASYRYRGRRRSSIASQCPVVQ